MENIHKYTIKINKIKCFCVLCVKFHYASNAISTKTFLLYCTAVNKHAKNPLLLEKKHIHSKAKSM